MDRQPSPVHHSYIVDRQDHLFHVAEIIHLIAGGHAAHPQVLILIVIECALVLSVRISEQDDAVRPRRRFLSCRQLEQIGAGNTVGHEVPVETDEQQKPPDLRGITEEFLRIAAESEGRILARLLEHALSLRVFGVQDRRRTQHDGIDEHDVLQEMIPLAQIHLVQIIAGDGRVGTGMLLPQDLVDSAAQRLFQLAESVPDQLVELGIPHYELRRFHIADPVSGHRIALMISPEIVHSLHKAQGPVRSVDIRAVDLVHVEDDDRSCQPAQFLHRSCLFAAPCSPGVQVRVLFFECMQKLDHHLMEFLRFDQPRFRRRECLIVIDDGDIIRQIQCFFHVVPPLRLYLLLDYNTITS